MSRFVTVFSLFLSLALSLVAQTGMPVVTQTLSDLKLTTGASAQTIDLRSYFAAKDVSGTVVQFKSVLGNYNVELLSTAAPNTVTNFLTYVNGGSYNNTIIHRSSKLSGTGNQIVQGGAYTYSLPMGSVGTRSPIALEYNLPNTRGTIAMARTSEQNSATSQWFFNLADNSTILGASNGGGYAVFGRVLGTGMTVVDAIGALTIYNVGGALTELPLRNVAAGQSEVQLANLINFTSVAVVPVYPTAASTDSVLGFTNGSTNSNATVVNAQISGSNLVLTPQANASGVSHVTIVATDTNGNTVTQAFRVGIAAANAVALPPASQSPAIGGSATFSVGFNGTPTGYQWLKNGTPIAGATSATYTVNNINSSDAGLYAVTVSYAGGSVTSDPAVLAPTTTLKVAGSAYEHGADIKHPNGNKYDQLLLTGTAATFTADSGQVTRLSYIDLNDDIVQVEFSGAGSVTVVLEGVTGPATPVNYNQPTVTYLKGHASIYVGGASTNTYISAFTVGKMTAYDPTGAYDMTKAVSDTNKPANNGNPIFKAATTYDGIADIARLAIASPTNRFGGLLGANANYWHDSALTGIYAPGITFSDGRFFLHDLNARGTASPVIRIGGASNTRVTGGNLKQENNASVVVEGLTQLRMAAGTDSHGNSIAAQANQGKLVNTAGADVTATVIVNP